HSVPTRRSSDLSTMVHPCCRTCHYNFSKIQLSYLKRFGSHNEKLGTSAIIKVKTIKMIKNGILSLTKSSIFAPVIDDVTYIIVPSGGVKVPILTQRIKKIPK